MFQTNLFVDDDDNFPTELRKLASQVPENVRFGTSSWTFSGWKDLVYFRDYESPRHFRRHSLSEYAQFPLFRAVGIDRGYYAPIPADDLRLYAEQLPAEFEGLSKVWQGIASPLRIDAKARGFGGELNPYFLDSKSFDALIGGPYSQAFARNCGPFVLEIPESRGRIKIPEFEERLDSFLGSVSGEWRFSVELREKRFLTPQYFEILARHGASHVFNYWSRMPTLKSQLASAGGLSGSFVVCRLLLPPGKNYAERKEALAPFDSIQDPQPQMRREVVALVREALSKSMIVYILVNNKAEGSSPLTIIEIAKELSQLAELSKDPQPEKRESEKHP